MRHSPTYLDGLSIEEHCIHNILCSVRNKCVGPNQRRIQPWEENWKFRQGFACFPPYLKHVSSCRLLNLLRNCRCTVLPRVGCRYSMLYFFFYKRGKIDRKCQELHQLSSRNFIRKKSNYAANWKLFLIKELHCACLYIQFWIKQYEVKFNNFLLASESVSYNIVE